MHSFQTATIMHYDSLPCRAISQGAARTGLVLAIPGRGSGPNMRADHSHVGDNYWHEREPIMCNVLWF
jgi:hypothetical protein